MSDGHVTHTRPGRAEKELAAYKAALRSAKTPEEREAGEAHPPPTLDRYFLDDTTVEAIARVLRDNPKGVVLINDEGSAWVRGMGQYKQKGGGADRSFWMKSWGMQPWSVTRVGNHDGPPLLLMNPFVAVLIGIQPELLPELIDDRGREDGFLARVLPVFPPSLPVPGANDATVSDDASAAWRQCVEKLLLLVPVASEDGKLTPHAIPFTDAGQREFNAFLDAMAAEMNAPGFPINLRAPWAKLKSYCARFALILQGMRWACGVVENFYAVDEASVRGAVALVAYFKSHIRRVYRQMPATPDDKRSERVVAWMRSRGGRATARDLVTYGVAGIKGKGATEEATAVLEELVRRGIVDRQEPPKGTPIYRLIR